MVSQSVHNTLSATAFIPLVEHGAIAVITAGGTAAVITSDRQTFTDATTLFKQYNYSEKSLKQMLLGDVEKCLYAPSKPIMSAI